MIIFKELIYQVIQAGQAPARNAEAREWYRDAASQFKGVSSTSPSRIIRQFEKKRQVADIEPGMMYLFRYDPKGKKTLPYYDIFPLIFPVEKYSDGFLGINFHYLPPILRAKLMDAVYSTVTNNKYDKTTKIRLSYAILKGAAKYKAYKPIVKHYLYDHVRSPFLEITAVEWDIALFLPFERFQKATKETVWKDSRSMI
jgi:hypothetical protein